MNADRSLFSLKPSKNRDTKLFDAYVGARDKSVEAYCGDREWQCMVRHIPNANFQRMPNIMKNSPYNKVPLSQ